jgi:hypothetical protein
MKIGVKIMPLGIKVRLCFLTLSVGKKNIMKASVMKQELLHFV